jgi:WD40 repeat protein
VATRHPSRSLTATLQFTLRGHGKLVKGLAFAPDGNVLAVASDDKKVRLWDPHTGRRVQELADHVAPVVSVAFAPDGRLLACGTHSRRRAVADEIVLWDLTKGNVLQRWRGHSGAVSCLAFAPDGRTLVSGSYDTSLRLWDVATGAVRWQVCPAEVSGRQDEYNRELWSVVCAPDGSTFASGCSDGSIILWDARTCEPVRSLDAHPECVYSVAFSPDGRTLASGSLDQTARLWDVATGAVRHTLTGYINYVVAVAMSSDGATLATGTQGTSAPYPVVGALRLWDTRTGKLAASLLEEQSAFVSALAFAPHDRLLAAGDYDRTVTLWQLGP